MSCTRFMTSNLADTSTIADGSASSEQTPFPATNAYDSPRRSKVWRSSGYFEITSSNKTLVFEETDGVDLTATLSEGGYATFALLAVEIKTQMEAAGSSVYTIGTESGTGKIEIVSDGGGGGGILDIEWTGSTGLASTLGFLTTEDDTGALSYVADVLRISTGEWIKWDMGLSSNPLAFVMIGPRNSAIKITPSSTIKLQGNETDVWTGPSYEQSIAYDDAAMIVLSSAGLHTGALRFWRILIEDIANSNGYVEIGQIFIGDYFQATRGAVQFPFTDRQIDRSATVFSQGGQSFSDIRQKSGRFPVEWFGLTTAEKESIQEHWRLFGKSIPFFVIMDPDEVFSSADSYYTKYVKYEGEPEFRLVRPGIWEAGMTLLEQL